MSFVPAQQFSKGVSCKNTPYIVKHAAATDAVRLAGQSDEEIIIGLQAGITIWMEELKSVYQLWADLPPEYAQQITGHQEAFMDDYRAQLAVRNAQFGSPSRAVLERGMDMLAEHCTQLCSVMSSTQNSQ